MLAGIDWQAVQAVGTVITFIVSATAFIYMYISSRHRAKAEDMVKLDRRVTRLETSFKNLPSASDLAKLGNAIVAVGGDVKALHATVEGVKGMLPGLQAAITMINEYLLDAKK